MRSESGMVGAWCFPPLAMDLATDYLGLPLKTPFVIGASPLADDVDIARRMEDAGASAIVMRSLFEEQLEPPPCRAASIAKSTRSGLARFPAYADYQFSPKQYLRQTERLKRALTIPVIASLNGHQPGGWTTFARSLQDAGADAIELNFYQVVTDAAIAADRVETEMLEAVGGVTRVVDVPVAVKLSPFHASVAQLAVALELEGAAGVVVFNRFYQPDINADELTVEPHLQLSEPQELLLRLRWLAILSPQLRGSLAVTGGVHSTTDAVKAILAGAHAVQLVSALLKNGPAALEAMGVGLVAWMRDHGFDRVEKFRGRLNLRRFHNPAAFERANYIRTLQTWKA